MTMEHTEAIDKGAAERYALREMSEPERDQYEEHFFDCPECAEEVRAAAIFLDNAEAVVRAKPFGWRTQADPSPGWQSGWKALFWPVPLAAAATLTLSLGGPAAYLAFFRLPQLERVIAEGQTLQAAPSYFLSVSRSEPEVVRVSPAEHRVALTLSRSSDRTFPFYLCEVRDASDRALISNVIPGPRQEGELQILLPTDKLHPGTYVIAVAGLDSASSRSPASAFIRYPFAFEHAPVEGAHR